ncbi:hypothetical protein BCR44DRAFT_1103008 [Catenaria anguillulae PL171]|uniref:Uncharacterized protein n=1 Tax=Catenaria anguillulae PL171 TaxID=765915 RepID=A0A1Y2I4M3_9FUNG|nr:hypothetical protein BCR44DRAFT_1103008 [Catenaria anguillulae PL171]
MDAPHQPPQPVRPAEYGHHQHHAYPFHDSRHWHNHYDPYTGMPPPPPLPRQSSRVESIEMPNPMSPASTSVSATDLTNRVRPHTEYPPVYQAQSASGANPSPRGSTILAAGPHASYNDSHQPYPPHRHPSDQHLHGQPLPPNPYHAPPPPPPRPFPTHPHYASEYDPHAYAWHARPDAPYYPGHPPMYPPEAYYHYMRAGASHPAPAPPPRAHDPSVYAHGPYPDPETVYPRYPLPPDSFAYAYAQADTNRPDGAAAGEARQSSGGRRCSRAAAALASGRATMGRARTDRGAAGHTAGSEGDEQDEIESEADEEAEEEEDDELEEEAGASDRGECADQACGGNEPGGAAEQKRRNYFVFSKVAYELMVRAIRVDRGLDELPAGMQATQGTQHALEVAHWVCGLRRKKWTRLKARLDMDESQPFFRSLSWKKCTMQIIPREDWPDLIRQAHELTDEIGNVTHLSLKQTFRRVRASACPRFL